jgi:3-deoxy-manno-octulosonate cytidylyltransferase (CMP-KDO synthetase)
MTTPRVAIVIPARMGAARLPGKPLADLCGHPMIAWMVAIARAAEVGPVLVAAGEAAIVAAAEAAGARAVLTDPALPSGTDRVWAGVAAADLDADVIVNLQGDMPTLPSAYIAAAIAALGDDADIATLTSPSDDPADRDSPNVVKAIAAADGRCLYFTRSACPSGPGSVERHVGIYVYRREALAKFVAAPPSVLERREKLEQLRALELGMTIRRQCVSDFPKGVDSHDDLMSARQALLHCSLPKPSQ